MTLSNVDLAKLIEKAIEDELTEREIRKLTRCLSAKFLDDDLNYRRGKVVLAAFVIYGKEMNNPVRKQFIDQALHDSMWRRVTS